MSGSRWSRERLLAIGFVLPALAWTIAFFLIPFGFMIVMSLWRRAGTELVREWSLVNYLGFAARPHFVEGLLNSLEIAATVTVASVALAYPLAWFIATKVPTQWQRIALALAIVPFWTSYVVRSYAWTLVLSKNGVINEWLSRAGLVAEPLQLASTRFATITGFVHFFVMLATLTIFANLKQLSPNYARAAADLGAGSFQTFRHVVLPLTLPGIAVGAFLSFALCLGDYITPQILGGNNELVLPQIIMLQLGRRADFPMASALSIILMITITVAYLACARWLKMERV